MTETKPHAAPDGRLHVMGHGQGKPGLDQERRRLHRYTPRPSQDDAPGISAHGAARRQG